MFPHHKQVHGWQILVAGALLGLAGCGSGARPTNSGNFSGTVAIPSEGATAALASRPGVANVMLSPAHLVGGASAEITVNLTQPAPSDGIAVRLSSSDASLVATPATVRIPSGQTSATVAVLTSPVVAATTVAISALYANTVAGTSLSVVPSTKSAFTVSLQPSTITIAPGQSGSVKVTTKITTGYNHALHLSVSNVPAGVSLTLTPAVIPAPGAGTSKAAITVQSSVATGTYSIRVTASDGKTSWTAKLTLKVASSDPGATFQGCWYKQSGHRYQGVRISVANPGTYPFDAVLYYGATCDPAKFADEFGFGTLLNFGGFDYIFWFRDFADQSDMSAFWYVGNDKSQCVNYAVAPDC